MKKIVKLFGIMTIAAALLVSCKPTTEDPTNPDAGKTDTTVDSGKNSEAEAPGNNGSGGNGGNQATGGNSGDTTSEVIVFDAATATAPEGTEIVELDGVKYLKITPNKYNTSFVLPEAVNIAGKTKIVVTMKADADDEGFQAVVACKDEWTAVCQENKDPTMKPLSGTAKDYEGDLLDSVTQITRVQPMTQECKNWQAQDNITVYIAKIIAK